THLSRRRLGAGGGATWAGPGSIDLGGSRLYGRVIDAGRGRWARDMSIREWGIVSEDIGGQQAEDGAPPEPAPPLAPAPAPVALNGLEVADWLIEPLFDAAVNGL